MANNFKTNIKILIIWLILFLIITFFAALLTYFKIININNNSIAVYIIGLICFFILGFLSGNIKQTNGLFNGIIFSIFVIIILVLLFILGFEYKITFKNIIKYLIFIFISALGGVLGVNFKSISKNK